MDIDEARIMLEDFAIDLTNGNYTTADDPHAHRKLEALQIILARHEKLEKRLNDLDTLRDHLRNAIKPLL